MEFAIKLIDTQSFATFLDGYLEDQITNFDLVNSILYYNGKMLNKRYKLKDKTLFNGFEENKKLEQALNVY